MVYISHFQIVKELFPFRVRWNRKQYRKNSMIKKTLRYKFSHRKHNITHYFEWGIKHFNITSAFSTNDCDSVQTCSSESVTTHFGKCSKWRHREGRLTRSGYTKKKNCTCRVGRNTLQYNSLAVNTKLIKHIEPHLLRKWCCGFHYAFSFWIAPASEPPEALCKWWRAPKCSSEVGFLCDH